MVVLLFLLLVLRILLLGLVMLLVLLLVLLVLVLLVAASRGRSMTHHRPWERAQPQSMMRPTAHASACQAGYRDRPPRVPLPSCWPRCSRPRPPRPQSANVPYWRAPA